MKHWNIQLAVLMVAGASLLHGGPVQAQSHHGDCSKQSGIAKARCERHEKMFAQCGPVKGDAHFECDRQYLLANPLDCSAVGATDAKACEAEIAAFKTCESSQGRAFVRCVRDSIKDSPMGH
jgi:hypothetical protein